MENLFKYLPLLLQWGPTIKHVLDVATSNQDAATKIKNLAPSIVPILEQIGGYLFPKADKSIHAVGGAIAAFDPNIVKWVQKACNEELDPSPNLSVDGVLGPHTRDAIMKLQQELGVPIDGLPGLVTQAALSALQAKGAK